MSSSAAPKTFSGFFGRNAPFVILDKNHLEKDSELMNYHITELLD
jgi:hypothetical protein